MTWESPHPRWASTAAVAFAVIGILAVHCLEPAFTHDEHPGSGGHAGFADLSSIELSVIHGACDLDAPDVPAAPTIEVCGIAGLSGWPGVDSSNSRPEAGRLANRALLTALAILRL